jgi:chemotaxis methyl-accepting protein methylase
LDESFEHDEEPGELETIVLKNVVTLIRAKNKFKMLRNGLSSLKMSKAFFVGDGSING